MNLRITRSIVLPLAVLVCIAVSSVALGQSSYPEVSLPLFKNAGDIPENFRRENLIAWCIVPFDVKKRSPEERTEMLVRLGINRCAYDWRKEHVPTFEREIVAYQKRGIEFSAFWGQQDEAFTLFDKHKIRPQIWSMLPQPKSETQAEKVAEAMKAMTPLASKCKEMKSQLGLYNHGGWAGKPENLIAVCEALRKAGFADVGIVYNFHHSHEEAIDAAAFSKSLEQMKPYLMCLNLNGMVDYSNLGSSQKAKKKIQPIGRGTMEAAMIDAVIKMKYDGPIGVLGHVNTRDVEEVLRENVEGLEYILGARMKTEWLAALDEADYMAKWTPKARKDSKFPYESEKDPDWVDDRASLMDYGLRFNHSIIVPLKRDADGKVLKSKKYPKAMAFTASGQRDEVEDPEWIWPDDEPDEEDETETPCHLLFDTEQLNVVASWSGDFIEISPARFGILKMPTVKGIVDWVETKDMRWQIADEDSGVFSSVSKEQVRFDGYLDPAYTPVEFNYTLSETNIKDSPEAYSNSDGTSIWRKLVRSASKDSLRLPLLRVRKVLELKQLPRSKGNRILFIDTDGEKCIAVSHAKLLVEKNVLYAAMPPSNRKVITLVGYATYSDSELDAEDVLDDALVEVLREFRSEENAGLEFPTNAWGLPIYLSKEKVANSSEADSSFAVETIPVPLENSHNALMFTSGFDFLDASTAFVCTVHGDVWRVSGLDSDLEKVKWKRIATGLFQPLGLKVVDGKPIVMCRDRLTRLHDKNGDGETDFYENFNDDLVVTGQNHAYAMSLETDPEGNFYFIKSGGTAPHGGTMLKLSKDGKDLSVFATGYRHANGLGVSPAGVVTSADNEGNWIPATRIDMVEQGGFYGHMPTHRRETAPETYDPPLVWIPRSIDNSAGGQTWVPNDSKSWAPLAGKMIHFSFGRCTANVVLPQKVGGVNQAAIYRLDIPRFKSGAMRGRFNPADGHLYVCGLDGWQTAAVQDGHFQRVRATGKPFYQPTDFAVFKDRVEISFNQPLDSSTATKIKNWSVQRWNYRWTKDYGSDHYSVEDPEKIGHDDVAVSKISLSENKKVVKLFIDDLKPVMQMSIRGQFRAADGHEVRVEMFNTIHALK